jgi:hypothetical protein
MTPADLVERIVTLQSAFDDAHRRVLAALEANDLRGLVEAARDQGALCTEQGSVLAQYVAVAITDRLDLSPAERARVQELARQLGAADDGSTQAKAAG